MVEVLQVNASDAGGLELAEPLAQVPDGAEERSRTVGRGQLARGGAGERRDARESLVEVVLRPADGATAHQRERERGLVASCLRARGVERATQRGALLGRRVRGVVL